MFTATYDTNVSKAKVKVKKFIFSTRIWIYSLAILVILVLVNFWTTSNRLAVVVNMSLKVRPDAAGVFYNLSQKENVSARLAGNISLNYFQTEENADTFIRSWMKARNATDLSYDEAGTGNDVSDENNKTIYDLSLTTVNTLNFDKSLQINGSKHTPRPLNRTPDNANIPLDIYGNIFLANGSKTHSRQDNCTECFKHSFEYAIKGDNICQLQKEHQVIELIVLIFTTHGHVLQRNAIRETWMTPAKGNTANIRYGFLLGEVASQNLRQKVLEESKMHQDIILQTFLDHYTNLTYKTMMAFEWLELFCPQAKFVMKTDDDMYVNVQNVLSLVQKEDVTLQTSVLGACAQKAKPIRAKLSKWYASYQSYPGQLYPGFCSGTGYVTSSQVAKDVHRISPNVPFFHLEDVYVALCISKLKYHLQKVAGFNTHRVRFDPCVYKGNNFYTSHMLSSSQLRSMWNKPCVKHRTRSRVDIENLLRHRNKTADFKHHWPGSPKDKM